MFHATDGGHCCFLGTLIDALVYLNDEHERTEDCVAIRACYMPPPLEHDKAAAATEARV